MQLLQILNDILKTKTIQDVAKELNVAKGTVQRWLELSNVPPSYCFELFSLAKIDVDYSQFTYKEKDQFFTPTETCQYCLQKTTNILAKYNDDINEYCFIEPSAGSGNFLNILPQGRRIGIDIEPRHPEIIAYNYLKWKPPSSGDDNETTQKYICFGNPPFGLRGQMALKFINHSYEFADYVCFILPQLFESDGKGVPRKRVIGYNLIYSEKINSNFIDPDNRSVKVECIFQIWSKHHKNDEYVIKKMDSSVIQVYSLSDGGTPSTTRNKEMFYECHVYLPSTCFGKHNMRYYESFDVLPGKKGYGVVFKKNIHQNINKFKTIDWSNVAFLSTNSAYNIRTSQIVSQFS